MALRVGHYSTAGPALEGAQDRARGSARQGRDFRRGQGRQEEKEKKRSRRLCIAKSRHWLAGVKFWDDAQKKQEPRTGGEPGGPTACTDTSRKAGAKLLNCCREPAVVSGLCRHPSSCWCLQLPFWCRIGTVGNKYRYLQRLCNGSIDTGPRSIPTCTLSHQTSRFITTPQVRRLPSNACPAYYYHYLTSAPPSH